MPTTKRRKPKGDDGKHEYIVNHANTAEDGVLYQPGDTIKLTEERAAQLRKHGVSLTDAEEEATV